MAQIRAVHEVLAEVGAGVDALRARIEERLPRPDVEITALVPHCRGDMSARLRPCAATGVGRPARRRWCRHWVIWFSGDPAGRFSSKNSRTA